MDTEARLKSCKERALRILGARPKSCKELYDRLLEKGEEPEDAAATIAWLLDLKFLDDELYAAMLVRSYAGKAYGLRRVTSELYRHGVDKKLWDSALEEMPDTEDTVYTLLCRKLKSENPDRAEIKKATDALSRRGFSWDEIKSALNRFRDEHPDFD